MARMEEYANVLDAAAGFVGAYLERIDAAQKAEAGKNDAERKNVDLETRFAEYRETYGAVILALKNVARYLSTPPEEGTVVDFHSEILREKAQAFAGEDKDANLYKLLTAMVEVMEGVRGIGSRGELTGMSNASLVIQQYLPSQEQARFIRGIYAYHTGEHQQAERELEIFRGEENSGLNDPVGMYFLALTVRTQNMGEDNKPRSHDRHEWYKWLMWKAHELEPELSKEMEKYLPKEKIPTRELE